MKKRKMSFLTLVLITLLSCTESSDSIPSPGPIDPGNDPNFTIVANTDEGLTSFNRKVVVFDIDIYAVAGVEDVKLLHAANLMAQYMDNDEDGYVDDPKVLNAMKDANAFLVMWKNESDLDNLDPPNGREGQDLGNDETRPEWHTDKTGAFDAALEEVWHIITNAGYANAYPEDFGTREGTTLANAMDIARGGHFTQIPNPYPPEAWYSYDDQTCDYDCMAGEYIYWGMSSILGAQENRLDEIRQEWKLNTKTKIQSTDVQLYALLTNPKFNLPTQLPDGTYKH